MMTSELQGSNIPDGAVVFEPLQPKVVLGVGAHPDDLDFMAAGTFAVWAAQGAKIYMLILTDGSKGTADPTVNAHDLIAKRQDEQRAAAQKVGITDVYFMAYEDGALEVTMGLKQDIVRYIRHLKPEVVCAFDPSMVYAPQRGFINHPDHRACGQATLDAVYPLARDHLSMPALAREGLAPHKVSTVLLSNLNTHNFAVNISTTIDTKLQALHAHVSQTAGQDQFLEQQRRYAAAAGEQYGYAYAELFVRIDVRD
jgi:LmbE family N-acetylglucosaminyl deacetylase